MRNGIYASLMKISRNFIFTMPLLTYWARYYVLILMISLLLLSLTTGIWIWSNNHDHLYQLLELQAEHLAEQYDEMSNIIKAGVSPGGWQLTGTDQTEQFIILIADESGQQETIDGDYTVPHELSQLHRMIFTGQTVREQVRIDSQTWMRVGVPVYQNGTISKALYISLPTGNTAAQFGHLYGPLALLTIVVWLIGCFMISYLSRKLMGPLRKFAAAAQSISNGKYDPALPEHIKERELKQLAVSFQNISTRFKQLERLRSDLLAGVSHELRTPLTSIRGMIQAVQSKVVAGKEAEVFLKISLDEARRLQRMVDDLLDLSSLETWESPIEQEHVNLSHLVCEVVHQTRIVPEFSMVQLECITLGKPVWIIGDHGQLRQVLLHLLNNSRKASATKINITIHENRNGIILDVQDNGKGIAPAEQPHIFERFYRGNFQNTREKGLGLGLTISRLLARTHGGDLILKNTSPTGTIFRLYL